MEYTAYSAEMMKQQLDHALLDREEEVSLLRLAKQGDKDAIEKIFIHNQKLVRSVAQKYFRSGMCGDQDLSDVIQWGNLGLMKAIEKWDEGRDTRFSTYAVQWIRSFVRRLGIMKGSGVSISFHASDMTTKIRKARNFLMERLEREPTIAEIARKVGLSEFDVQSALTNQSAMVSIDASVSQNDKEDGNELLLKDIMPDAEAVSTEEKAFQSLMIQHLLKTIHSMPRRSRLVMLHRYGLDNHEEYTLDRLASHFKVSRTTIQNVEKEAVEELRKSLFSWVGLISR